MVKWRDVGVDVAGREGWRVREGCRGELEECMGNRLQGGGGQGVQRSGQPREG